MSVHEYQKGYKGLTVSKEMGWYDEPPNGTAPLFFDLFRTYVGIQDDKDIIKHVNEYRKKAYDICQYPCIGNWAFISMNMTDLPEYPDIVQRLKNGQKFVDFGCFWSVESRKLVADGCPSGNISCMDLETDYFDLSYDLFKDRDTFKALFYGACDARSENLATVKHYQAYDIIYTGYVLHLFQLAEQPKILANLIKMLKPQSGSMICGVNSGIAEPPEGMIMEVSVSSALKDFFMHSPETTKMMIEKAAPGWKSYSKAVPLRGCPRPNKASCDVIFSLTRP